MRYVVPVCLFVVGTIHLLPMVGVLGASQLETAYGVRVASDPSLELLLRHRAVLFGVLGTFLVASAVTGKGRTASLLAGFAAVTSFLVLALSIGNLNEELTQVFRVDLVALALLSIALLTLLRRRN